MRRGHRGGPGRGRGRGRDSPGSGRAGTGPYAAVPYTYDTAAGFTPASALLTPPPPPPGRGGRGTPRGANSSSSTGRGAHGRSGSSHRGRGSHTSPAGHMPFAHSSPSPAHRLSPAGQTLTGRSPQMPPPAVIDYTPLPADRQLLMVTRDTHTAMKAQRAPVYELRVPVGQRFSMQWLAAVGRWADKVAAQQQGATPGTYTASSSSAYTAGSSTVAVSPPPPPPPPPPPCAGSISPAAAVQESSQTSGQTMVEEDEVGEVDEWDGPEEEQEFDDLTQDVAAEAAAGAAAAGAVAAEKEDGADGAEAAAGGAAGGAALDAVDDAAAEAAAAAQKDAAAGGKADAAEGAAAAPEAADTGTSKAAAAAAATAAVADEAAADDDSRSTASSSSEVYDMTSYLARARHTSTGVFGSPGAESDESDDDDDDSWVTESVDYEEEEEFEEGGPGSQQQQQSHAAAAAAAAAARASAARAAAEGRTGGGGGGGGAGYLVKVSLRLERQGITDKELEMLAGWYAGHRHHLAISKLWLFDNNIGDAGAAACAALVGPSLLELHLSHNHLSCAGVKALLGAVPTGRAAAGGKPLWLRIEWNHVECEELQRFVLEDCADRGLLVDVAEEIPVTERQPATPGGRQANLKWHHPWNAVQVQMPWISCQRRPPAEAPLLQLAKDAYSSHTTTTTSSRAPAVDVHAAVAAAVAEAEARRPLGAAAEFLAAPPPPPATSLAAPPPPPPHTSSTPSPTDAAPAGAVPPPAAAVPSTAAAGAPAAAVPAAPPPAPAPATAGGGAGGDVSLTHASGPLLLFPDTSALLSMLGVEGRALKTGFTMSLLKTLADNGRFGRGLPPQEQTFLVLADRVVKQLDSLKTEPGAAAAVRRFLFQGLDELGPKGGDFLTVLGAHEGEGLVVDRQAAVAGSSSRTTPTDKGQHADLAIIQVALLFRSEILAAAAEEGLVGGEGTQQQQPVVLLTNDNGQLQLAKCHGLPAFRLAGADGFEAALMQCVKSGAPLTSTTLRAALAPAAFVGVNAPAGRSVQEEFDGAVACLTGLLTAYQDLTRLVGQVEAAVAAVEPGSSGGGPAAAALERVRALLGSHQHLMPFIEGGGASIEPPMAAAASGEAPGATVGLRPPVVAAAAAAAQADPATGSAPAEGRQQQQQGGSVAAAAAANMAALSARLRSWEGLVRSHQAPSRVVRWANST